MANIGFYKILNTLPITVEGDSFYLVSDADRFDLYVTSNGVTPTAVRLANVKHLQEDTVPDSNNYYEGDEWLDVLTMTKYKLYYDGTKKIWVEVGNNPTMNPDLVYLHFQFAKNSSATTAPTSGWQDSPPTISAGEYVWMRTGEVIPPATSPSSWSTATRVTGEQGLKGDDGVQLGETSTTAYRGDRGKLAYDHSLTPHAPSNAQKNSDITKGEIEAKLVGEITTHSHTVTNTDVTSALGFTPMDASIKGTNSGVAELDATGKVPAGQLPSYVDDVLEFASLSAFPSTGESGKIYTATDTNIIYRWGGTGYVEISSTIALGETNNTAYRGDRGKIAYDHSQVAHAPADAQKNSNITKGEIEAKLTGVISTHSHTVTKANVGLGNVDNTSDLNKPISTATQTALNTKLDTTVFDNLEIGGRNLIISSEKLDINIAGDSTKTLNAGVDVDGGNKAIRLQGTSFRMQKVVKSNGVHTFSMWVKKYPQSTTESIKLDICDGSNTYYDINDSWQKIILTHNVTNFSEETYNFVDIELAAGFDILIYHPKLEKGHKATDWTPAPEDIDAALNAKLDTSGTAYDSARLGGYSAASYPRKAEAAVITGAWKHTSDSKIGLGSVLAVTNEEASSEPTGAGLYLGRTIGNRGVLLSTTSASFGQVPVLQFRLWQADTASYSSMPVVASLNNAGSLRLGSDQAANERLHVTGNGRFEGAGIFEYNGEAITIRPASANQPSFIRGRLHDNTLHWYIGKGGTSTNDLIISNALNTDFKIYNNGVERFRISAGGITSVFGSASISGAVAVGSNITAEVGTFTDLNIGANKLQLDYVAKAGEGIKFEEDAVNKVTEVKTTNAAALLNIESAAGATQPTINSLINDRLFEVIALSLSGYGEDVTTDSQETLMFRPYNFKAYELIVEFVTPPTGSSAIVTFYNVGVSIGAVTIPETIHNAGIILSSPILFEKSARLDVKVTQVGLTTPGATAKAYLRGIKY